MKFFQNEKGVTLIEILVSVVILSIILISLMQFFPQMGFMNKQNEDKAQAINTAKQLLISWQNSSDVENFLNDPTSAPPAGFLKQDANYYYFTAASGSYTVNIKIKIANDLSNVPSAASPIEAHFIQVQLLNQRGNAVAETYGYIKVE